jgi:hypothetical protein
MRGDGQNPQQACDNCRCRKVKCDRGSPCNHCLASSLQCRYLHVIRRKGPKRGVGRRLSQLRRGVTEIDNDFLEITTPNTLPGINCVDRSRTSDDRLQSQPTHSCPSQSATKAPEEAPPSTSLLSDQAFSDAVPIDAARETRQLSLSMVAHIQAFLRHMFPIMPVVDGEELLADAVRLDELTPSRYALIVSLCAATRVQLGLDKIEDRTGNLPGVDIPSTPQVTGEMLLSMAEMSLSQYSIIDDYSLDSILTSFFLFAGYGNLDNARRAWFYLNQSITLAQALSLTSEEGYCGLLASEREVRRRIFWLLFVTERRVMAQSPIHVNYC